MKRRIFLGGICTVTGVGLSGCYALGGTLIHKIEVINFQDKRHEFPIIIKSDGMEYYRKHITIDSANLPHSNTTVGTEGNINEKTANNANGEPERWTHQPSFLQTPATFTIVVEGSISASFHVKKYANGGVGGETINITIDIPTAGRTEISTDPA